MASNAARLKSLQAQMTVLIEAAERCQDQGWAVEASMYLGIFERLEAREEKLRKAVKDGAAEETFVAKMRRNTTHCPAGHPYAGENLGRRKNGDRFCKTCKRIQQRVGYQRRKKTTKRGA